ncbi:DUF2752 domain-containing protein [Butyrivibrio sp. MC2021]|uniref:DUF2752 domain-containing protein n=1 Tax=Butyrivibrio sp. MC2021 TaxID=1408306 RepID=UPI00068758EA
MVNLFWKKCGKILRLLVQNAMERRWNAIDKRDRIRALAKEFVPIGIFVILYIVAFSNLGFGLPCIFRWVTGLMCPGCGMSHALAAIVRLDFGEAAKWNILSVTLLPVLIIFFIIRGIRYINKGKEDFRLWEILFLVACALVCAVFFIKRNNLL